MSFLTESLLELLPIALELEPTAPVVEPVCEEASGVLLVGEELDGVCEEGDVCEVWPLISEELLLGVVLCDAAPGVELVEDCEDCDD